MSISVENISYVYNTGTPMAVTALEEVSLCVNSGEFIGLIGHTGSGKSTLIQHLNGLLKATSGDIKFKGESIYAEKYPLQELRGKVGLVFQYPEHQLFEIDVFTDVCFGPKNQGLNKEEMEQRAEEALTMVGIDSSLYRVSPFELSGGQKRRVAIAGVLAMHPEVLILDEPTAGLDPKGRDNILNQIEELHKKNDMTVILVSHSMEDVAKHVGRIIVMNQGRVMLDGTPGEIFREYKQLEGVGLAAPQVTYIVQALKEAGISIDSDVTTIAQAKAELLKILK